MLEFVERGSLTDVLSDHLLNFTWQDPKLKMAIDGEISFVRCVRLCLCVCCVCVFVVCACLSCACLSCVCLLYVCV